jgi:ferric-dicitrate binding protein FerR (iron transport regulator)
MEVEFNDDDWLTITQWMEDPTFVNWANQMNADDVAKWEQYFNLHPGYWEIAKVARTIILGIPFKNIARSKIDGEEALTSLLSRIDKDINKESEAFLSSSKTLKRSWLVAASLAVLVVASAFIYGHFLYNPSLLLATEFGQQLESILPDGSKVILNANSKLRFYKQYPRKVWLDGEAYFEVKKKLETGENFQVITQDLSVTVLGTSFNVNTRNDETAVFLSEGKVLLDIADDKNEVIEMNPGELVRYSKKQEALHDKRTGASSLEVVSWKEGTLIFRDRPLMDALFQIEDIYGIQFVIQTDDLLEEKITGGVPIKDLQVTLNTLSEVYGLQMKATGKRYFITGRD